MYLLKDLHPDSKTTENFLTSYFCRQSAGITNQINGENELMLNTDIPCMQSKDRAPEKNHFTNYTTKTLDWSSQFARHPHVKV